MSEELRAAMRVFFREEHIMEPDELEASDQEIDDMYDTMRKYGLLIVLVKP